MAFVNPVSFSKIYIDNNFVYTPEDVLFVPKRLMFIKYIVIFNKFVSWNETYISKSNQNLSIFRDMLFMKKFGRPT